MKNKRIHGLPGTPGVFVFLFGALFLLPLVFTGCKQKKEPAQTSAPADDLTTQATALFQLPDSDPSFDRLFADNKAGTFELSLFPGDLSLQTGGTLADGTRRHTPLITVPNRILTADAGTGYRVYLCEVDAAGGQDRIPVRADVIRYLHRNARWAFVVERTDGAALSDTEEIRLCVTLLDPEEVRRTEDGLWSVAPFWGCAESYGGSIELRDGEQVSAPVLLSDGGLGVLFGGDASTAARSFRVAAFRLTDDGVLPAEDETLRQMSGAGDLQAQSFYIPAAADCYAALILNGDADPTLLTLTGGTAAVGTENRLTGLFNMTILYDETENGLFPRSAMYYSGTMMQGQTYLGALLRSSDVARIRCDARYELTAEYWSKDENGVLRKKKTQWAGMQPGGDAQRGFSELVPSADAGEWLLLCVHRRAEPTLAADGAFAVRNRGMGGMRGYDEVPSGVVVEYLPGCAPETVSFDDPVIAQNYRDITSLSIPYVYAGTYQRPQETDKAVSTPEMYDFCAIWYSGSRIADTLLHSITPRSYLTAARNPNSRYYRYPYPVGYGCTCVSFVMSVLGLTDTCSARQLFEDELLKFDRRAFNIQTDAETLVPGEVLVEMDPVTLVGHAVMVKDVIRTAGVVSAVTVIEGYPPFSRQRTFYCMDVSDAGSVLMRNCLSTNLEPYVRCLRVKPAYVRALRDVFDLAPVTAVGTVMCDRGSDSLYCIGTDFAELSVTDESAETLTVCRDGNAIKRLSLRDAERRNGCRVVRIESLLTAPGEYTVLTDRSDVVQERFYVPEKKTGLRFEKHAGTAQQPGGTMTISAESLAEIDSVFVYYKLPDKDETSLTANAQAQTSEYVYCVYPRERLSPAQTEKYGTGWGELTVPLTQNGRQYAFSRVLYRTPYGTFWIGNGKNGLIQTAEQAANR